MRDLRDESRYDFFECNHQSPVNYILISSNNQMLISGDIDGFIKIWSLQSGLLIRSVANSYSNKNWGIKCMINLPGSDEILICSKLAILRVLNLITFEFSHEFKGHTWTVSCAQLFTNQLVLSGSFDKTIKVWNLNRQTCIQTLQSKTSVFILAKIDDVKFVSANKEMFDLWQMNSDEKFECIQTIPSESGFFNDLKLVLSSNLLITSSPKLIVIRNLNDFKCVLKLSLNRASFSRSIEILPEHERLIVATQNNTLELWSLKTGRLLNRFKDYSSLINKMQVCVF